MANKQARILTKKTIDGVEYKPNQVIDADAALIKQLVKDGIACDDQKSVDYCLNEGEKPIAHKSPATAAAEAAKAEAAKAEAAKAEGIAVLEADIAKLDASLAKAKEADKAAIVTQIEAAQAELAKLQAA